MGLTEYTTAEDCNKAAKKQYQFIILLMIGLVIAIILGAVASAGKMTSFQNTNRRERFAPAMKNRGLNCGPSRQGDVGLYEDCGNGQANYSNLHNCNPVEDEPLDMIDVNCVRRFPYNGPQ